MSRTTPILVLLPLLLTAMLGGCATDLKAVGTYDEVWQAATEAMGQVAREDARRMGLDPEAAIQPPRAEYREGRYTLLVADRTLSLHYTFEIQPTGSREARDHDVRLRIFEEQLVRQQVDGTEVTTPTAARRRDLEEQVGRLLTRRLEPGAPSSSEPEAPAES